MLFNDVIRLIEETANPKWQADWDASGLQVVSTRQEINRIAVMLDALPDTVEQALDFGADFILTHHPLALKPGLPNKFNNYTKVLKLLLCADVACYAAHTSLDVNLNGPAGWLCRELNLNNVTVLEQVDNENAMIGYGAVGDLENPVNSRELLSNLSTLLEIDYGMLARPELLPDVISRIAYCGGSGSSMIEAAEQAEAQLFITGDIKYHSALEAGIAVFDVGHFSIEEIMMKNFAMDLFALPYDLNVDFIHSYTPFGLFFKKQEPARSLKD